MRARAIFWGLFLVVVVGTSLFALNTALFVAQNGANVPLRDEWEDKGTSYVAVKAASGQLIFADLFSPFHGHWIVPTKITTVLATWLTRWDVRAEMAVGFGVATLTLILIGVLLWRESRWAATLALIPIAALLYSHRQFQNWLWGLDNCWFYLNLFGLLGVWAAARQDPSRWIVRWGWVVLALLASLTLGGGIVTWPVMAILIWVRCVRDWRFWAVWVGAAAVVYLAFALNNAAISETYRYGSLLAQVGLWPGFFLALIGSLFVHGMTANLPLATVCGVIGIGLLGVNLFRLYQLKRYQALILWGGVALFALGGLTLITITRAQFWSLVPHSPLISRLSTLTVLLWAAIIASGALVLLAGRKSRWIGLLNLAALVGLGFSHHQGIQAQAVVLPRHFKTGQERCLTEYLVAIWPKTEFLGSCFTALTDPSDPLERDVIPQRVADMARLQLGAFATPPERPFNVGLSLAGGPVFEVKSIEGQRAQTFTQKAGTTYEQWVNIPDPSWRFTFASGITLADGAASPFGYRVLAIIDGQEETPIASGALGESGIRRFVADLSSFTGQRIRLRYVIDGPIDATALWVSPRITVSAPVVP